jgi:hypothetical protein
VRKPFPFPPLLRASLLATLLAAAACGDDTVDNVPVEAGPNKDATADGSVDGGGDTSSSGGDGGGGEAASDGGDASVGTDAADGGAD